MKKITDDSFVTLKKRAVKRTIKNKPEDKYINYLPLIIIVDSLSLIIGVISIMLEVAFINLITGFFLITSAVFCLQLSPKKLFIKSVFSFSTLPILIGLMIFINPFIIAYVFGYGIISGILSTKMDAV